MTDYQQALQTYLEATNTHDFDNVEKVLDDNAIYWFSDKTCVNRDEIRSYFENAWNLIQDEIYAATDVKWIAVAQNSATCIYTYTWEGFYQNAFRSGSGRATNVFVKNGNGFWKLKHEHLSSNP
ncbi:YybH family protein [Risungbinella massiliensis]|uniref:YybH family protein n=1 Tax=Risungbinella massiliensis TaxID=1329796 RepID=UPI0005CC2765|nr:nuclear transport factor 2 family protein [Risungbinella massiliensis]